MKRVAIPVETKAREFIGKIWLGLNILQNDNIICLGPAYELKYSFHKSKPDIYISNNFHNSKLEKLKILNNSGVKNCVIDTEGAVLGSVDSYGAESDEVFDYIEYNFTWGERQAKSIAQYTESDEKIVVTGNPSFDLLQNPYQSIYEDNGNELQKKYGNYVLFNTNFSWANHFDPKRHKRKQIERFGSYDHEKYNHFSKMFHNFMLAIHYLIEKDPKYNIIIRPHPSEDISTYRKLCHNCEHVRVIYDGNVRDWIAGAQAVIHNSCTTGIESAMMETPVIAYRPIISDTYDKDIPNTVSDVVNTKNELHNKINSYDYGERYVMSDSKKTELGQLFANVDHVAAEKIAEYIEKIKKPKNVSYEDLKPGTKQRIKFNIKKSSVSNIATNFYDEYHSLRGNTEPKRRREYMHQKFPGLAKHELISAIKLFDTWIDVSKIEVSPLPGTNHTYVLSKQGNYE